MDEFPKFWYESNACWGWVKNMDDLREKCNLQTDPEFGGLDSKDEFLDKSRLFPASEDGDYPSYGTRMEHSGKKTLREFLVANKVDITLL